MTHTSNPTAQNEKNPTPQTDFAESLSLLCKTAIVSLGSLFVSCCLKKRRHSSGLPGYSPSEATPRGENARDTARGIRAQRCDRCREPEHQPAAAHLPRQTTSQCAHYSQTTRVSLFTARDSLATATECECQNSR